MPEKKQILGYIHSTESFGAVDGREFDLLYFYRDAR